MKIRILDLAKRDLIEELFRSEQLLTAVKILRGFETI